MSNSEIELRYGCNPHQRPARVLMENKEDLPVKVLSGKPGYINFLDAVNSWQLVSELKSALKLPAAASFKHVSPAGAAVGTPMSDSLKKMYFVEDMKLSPLATAYARARGADRMSSFGDWAAVSEKVDASLANLLKREVSDGIIAPDYDDQALEILKKKKGGKYNVLKIDPSYVPPEMEKRMLFGITFEQRRNIEVPDETWLENVVTQNKEIPSKAARDLLTAMITLKYTQSNSVCYAYDGQVIGVGAGQQSRIHCTRLAGDKADRWCLRQHPGVLNMDFKESVTRAGRNNAIDRFLEGDLENDEYDEWKGNFNHVPEMLSESEKREWITTFNRISLASDAFFPFKDNIERADRSGVKYIIQPGGSKRDDDVIQSCDSMDKVMVFTGIREFLH
ncbi:MAG: phosphoribosylaminoimidazolecarboxamide formyltransferase [Chitinivibrionales bacterium]